MESARERAAIMGDALPDIFRLVAVLVIFAVLIGLRATGRNGGRGISVARGGLALLAIGAVTQGILVYFLEPQSAYALAASFLQEIGFFGGFVLIAVGILGLLKTSQMPDAPAVLVGSPMAASSGHASDLLASVLSSSLDGVLVVKAIRDAGGNLEDLEPQVMNSSAEQLLGRSAGDLIGKGLLKQVQCIRAEGVLDEAEGVLRAGLPYQEERFWTHGRSSRWYRIVAVKYGDGLAITIGDITDFKRSEEKLRHSAQHDALTGLANRALFNEALEQATHRSKRFPNYYFAVLFLDFDRFKIINDSLGHDAGDQLLINIAERLRVNLRELDTTSRLGEGHLPARLGGDEFVVLLDGLNDVRDAVNVAERLQSELSAPHVLDGHEVISTASIGIVFCEGQYQRPEDIMRDADTAMYRAKSTGKARHVVFDQRMHEQVVQRMTLERQLRDAVECSQFNLVYEPLVSLERGSLVGFEALVRWPHPELGIVRPDEFIGIAEELGLIVPLGEWVLREALAQLTAWSELPGGDEIIVSVNLSKKQLSHPSFVPMIKQVLEETGADAGRVWMEITESIVMHDVDGLGRVLDSIKELGVQLAMDDFGTGHSSLSCLHSLPFDIVKIDRSFINDAGKKRDYAAIVHAVVELTRNLNMAVVAEGTESADHLTLLQALNCEFAQGHYFSLPLSPAQATAMIDRGETFTVKAAA
jgi:diguanylate cyclase (GGDEF)-like protein